MQDEAFLKKHTWEMLKCELPQTYEANHSAMDYAENLLNSLGFETRGKERLSAEKLAIELFAIYLNLVHNLSQPSQYPRWYQ